MSGPIVILSPAELAAIVEGAVDRALAKRNDRAEVLDFAKHYPGSTRVANGLCRDGKVHGAVKVGKRWLVSRSDLEAFLSTLQGRARTLPAAAAGGAPWSPSAALSAAGVRVTR